MPCRVQRGWLRRYRRHCSCRERHTPTLPDFRTGFREGHAYPAGSRPQSPCSAPRHRTRRRRGGRPSCSGQTRPEGNPHSCRSRFRRRRTRPPKACRRCSAPGIHREDGRLPCRSPRHHTRQRRRGRRSPPWGSDADQVPVAGVVRRADVAVVARLARRGILLAGPLPDALAREVATRRQGACRGVAGDGRTRILAWLPAALLDGIPQHAAADTVSAVPARVRNDNQRQVATALAALPRPVTSHPARPLCASRD